jgi:hypothetical protein
MTTESRSTLTRRRRLKPLMPAGDQVAVAKPRCAPALDRRAGSARSRAPAPGASLLTMSEWVTQREAAELLGVHVSLVPKIVRRGDLTPRRERPSLSRAQVLQLREQRAQAEHERERRRASRSEPRFASLPPDDDYLWLSAHAAAAVLGCSVVALRARAVRGRLPSTLAGGRRWFRLDHLELAVRAEGAQRRRQIAP